MVEFKWMKGGEKVQVAGDFLNNWKDTLDLEKKGDFFTKTVEIKQKKIAFKFVVDGEWLLSEDYPQVKDKNGNLNNEIEMEED